MDKITEANFHLGEAGVYATLALGVVGLGAASYYGWKGSLALEIVASLITIFGLVVYVIAFKEWRAYERVRKEIK